MRFLVLLLALSFGAANAATVDVCTRSERIKAMLEKKIVKPCSKITDQDLLNVLSVTIYDGPISLLTGDFNGLNNAKEISIDLDMGNFALEPNVFSGLEIRELELGFPESGAIAKDAFNGLTTQSLTMAMYDTDAMKIEAGAFNGLQAEIIFVNLHGTKSDELFDNLVKEYPNLYFSKQ